MDPESSNGGIEHLIGMISLRGNFTFLKLRQNVGMHRGALLKQRRHELTPPRIPIGMEG